MANLSTLSNKTKDFVKQAGPQNIKKSAAGPHILWHNRVKTWECEGAAHMANFSTLSFKTKDFFKQAGSQKNKEIGNRVAVQMANFSTLSIKTMRSLAKTNVASECPQYGVFFCKNAATQL